MSRYPGRRGRTGKLVRSTGPIEVRPDEPPAKPDFEIGLGITKALRFLATRLRAGKMATDELDNTIKFAVRIRDSKKANPTAQLAAANLIRLINADLDRAAARLIRAEADVTMGGAGSGGTTVGATASGDPKAGGGVTVNILIAGRP